ncbi:MAG: hypothetical protein ABIJ34_08460 [archaeon]
MFSLIFAILLVFILPGIGIFFRQAGFFDNLVIAVGISIATDVILAFILGGTERQMIATGGLTSMNIVYGLLLVSLISLVIGIFRRRKNESI